MNDLKNLAQLLADELAEANNVKAQLRRDLTAANDRIAEREMLLASHKGELVAKVEQQHDTIVERGKRIAELEASIEAVNKAVRRIGLTDRWPDCSSTTAEDWVIGFVDRIAELEDDLAINKDAYSVWYKRCLDAEAERDKLRDALRPFAEAHAAAENDDIDDDTYETGEGFYRVDFNAWKQAAALMGDAKEAQDEKAK